MKLCLLALLSFLSFGIYAQKAPWAISMGNGDDQKSYNLVTDYEGNSIIAGSFKGTNVEFDPSPTGTALMSSTGDNDIFVAKYNSAGQYVWAFKVGGAGNDAAEYIKADASGNVYISGWFRGSNVDFDPGAGSAILNSNGEQGQDRGFAGDAFLAKYDANGNYQWAFNVGSSDILDFGDAIYIDDNGDVYWTGGFTGSNIDFDPSPATHTLNCLGVTSLFLAKYTSSGNYLWAVPFTGPSVVNAAGRSIAVDKSRNIYLAANFDGTIDIDPSSSSVHNLTANSCGDWFLVKLDSAANYIWGFNVGGSGCDYAWSLALDTSSNVYVTGFFDSYNIDFNPDSSAVDMKASHGGFDAFVAEYDQNGNHIYAQTFGSQADDMCFGITLNKTGYSLMGSFSQTVDFDADAGVYNLTSAGGTDGFVARYDRAGNFQNAFRLGGTGDDIVKGVSSYFDYFTPRGSSYPYEESMYVSGYFSSTNVDFDPSPGKLILSSNGGYDAFIAKYSDIEAINMIRGSMFVDKNSNGVMDAGEKYFNSAKIFSFKPALDTIATVTSNGQFGFVIDTGAYTTSAHPYVQYYNVVPVSHSTNFTTYYNIDTVLFAVQPVPGQRDLAIALIPLTPVRPGFFAYYKLIYQNKGTDSIANGHIELIKDSRLNYVASYPFYSSVSGDTIRWDFTNLNPDDTASIGIQFMISPPPATGIGDTLRTTATIYPVASDLIPTDNTTTLSQRVQGSYDPNDKTEIHGGLIKPVELVDGYLQYTIRFQNTGTDTAFNIILRDTLSANLDWNTIEMLSTSHSYQLTIKDGKFCEWNFNNIKLVDSFRNAGLSHGYIVFRIKARAGLTGGDTIRNRASIYFDYNPPVQTNIEYTIVERSNMPVKLISFTAVKDGNANRLNWSTAGEVNTRYFSIERGSDGRSFYPIGKVNTEGTGSSSKSYSFNDHEPLKAANYYRLKITDNDGRFEYSPIRKINNSVSIDISIYPNPVKNLLNVRLNNDKEQLLHLEIINSEGKTLLHSNWLAATGSSLKAIDVSKLSAGNYFVKFKSGDEVTVVTFEKL